MVIVGISGKRASGKTLLGKILEQNAGFIHLSLATPLKQICRSLFDLTEEQVNGADKEKPSLLGETPRQIMIETGKFFRVRDPNFWIKKLQDNLLKTVGAQQKRYVISDIRFKNEADWVKKHGGLLIRLERDQALTGPPIKDPSETQLDDYTAFDLRIPKEQNDTEDDMLLTAVRVMELLKNRETIVKA